MMALGAYHSSMSTSMSHQVLRILQALFDEYHTIVIFTSILTPPELRCTCNTGLGLTSSGTLTTYKIFIVYVSVAGIRQLLKENYFREIIEMKDLVDLSGLPKSVPSGTVNVNLEPGKD